MSKSFDRKRREAEDQEATGRVFQDFITIFQDTPVLPQKTFVKSGVLFSEETQNTQVGQIYAPKPIIKPTPSIVNALECAKILKESKPDRHKKQDKPKSNLEQLKEELKMRHKNRDAKAKGRDDKPVYYDGEDPNTTNLFVANLNPKINSQELMTIFGHYGPLASVKIMLPRGDDKSKSGSICGFVAFMCRKDAERALVKLRQRSDMRVGWGKYVEVPAYPIYVPPKLLNMYLPPPKSGLPFNAQPFDKEFKRPTNREELDRLLHDSIVKVTMPLDKKVLTIVHRMVEFVVREGPMFEAIIMTREMHNSDYKFLFDTQSPVHIYYRWKLYSILHSESTKQWSMKPFRMYDGGPIWLPPIAPDYVNGMPDSFFDADDKHQLSEAQCSRLINTIRNLNVSRTKVAEAMVFCMNHGDAMDDVVDVIVESLTGDGTCPMKRMARLYLLSDLFHNCLAMKVPVKLITDGEAVMFKILQAFYKSIQSEPSKKADAYKVKLLKLLHYWDSRQYFLFNLSSSFNSIFNKHVQDEDDSSGDEPLDGANLLKRGLKNQTNDWQVVLPLKLEEKVQEQHKKSTFNIESFVQSKWNTLDPEEVQSQAMSTQKLFYLEQVNNVPKQESVPVNLYDERRPYKRRHSSRTGSSKSRRK